MGLIKKLGKALGLKFKEVEKPKDPLEGKVGPGDVSTLEGCMDLDIDQLMITSTEHKQNNGDITVKNNGLTFIRKDGGEFTRLEGDYYSGDDSSTRDGKRVTRVEVVDIPPALLKFIVSFSVLIDGRIHNGNMQVVSRFGKITSVDGTSDEDVYLGPKVVVKLAALTKQHGTKTETKNEITYALTTYQFKKAWLDDIVKILTINTNNQQIGSELKVQGNNGTVLTQERAVELSKRMLEVLSDNKTFKEYSFNTVDILSIFELCSGELVQIYMSDAEEKLMQKKALGEHEINVIESDIEIKKAKEKALAKDKEEPEGEDKKE